MKPATTRNTFNTRMHSSRMRIARGLTVSGVYLVPGELGVLSPGGGGCI